MYSVPGSYVYNYYYYSPNLFIYAGKLWPSGSLLQPLPTTLAFARNTVNLDLILHLEILEIWHTFSKRVHKDTLND